MDELVVTWISDEEFWELTEQVKSANEEIFECISQTMRLSQQTDSLYGIYRNGVLIPAFCTVIEDGPCSIEVNMIWVHPTYRRQGLGRSLIEQLKIAKAANFLPGSEPFWQALGLINTSCMMY